MAQRARRGAAVAWAGAKPHAKCRIEESTLKPPMLRLWSASLAAALQVRCRSSLPHAKKLGRARRGQVGTARHRQTSQRHRHRTRARTAAAIMTCEYNPPLPLRPPRRPPHPLPFTQAPSTSRTARDLAVRGARRGRGARDVEVSSSTAHPTGEPTGAYPRVCAYGGEATRDNVVGGAGPVPVSMSVCLSVPVCETDGGPSVRACCCPP